MSGRSNSNFITIYAFDFNGAQIKPTSGKTTTPPRNVSDYTAIRQNELLRLGNLEAPLDQLRFITTNQIAFPPHKNKYSSGNSLENPSIKTCPPVSSCGTKITQPPRRSYEDKPGLIYHLDKTRDTEKAASKRQQETLSWSRFPPGGCQSPQICPDPIVEQPTCNCPQSCCSRITCDRSTPVCICATPCSHPTGDSVICNACLCYVLPEKEKSNYYCPRTQTDNPTCPQCKRILPPDNDLMFQNSDNESSYATPTRELIKKMQLEMPLPITLQNVAKTCVPVFHNLESDVSVYTSPVIQEKLGNKIGVNRRDSLPPVKIDKKIKESFEKIDQRLKCKRCALKSSLSHIKNY